MINVLKGLQKLSLIISILVAVYILISGNYNLFPLIPLFQILSLFIIMLHDFKEGQKAKGSVTLIIALFLSFGLIYVLFT